MDIYAVNDFLIAQATGLTKEQVKKDIADIVTRRLEVETAETTLRTLTESIEKETARNTELKLENSRLQKIHDTYLREYKVAETAYTHIITTLPALKAEAEGYIHALIGYKDEVAKAERLITEAEGQYNTVEALKLDVTKEKQEAEAIKRHNVIQTKKLEEMLSDNTAKVALINLNKTPAHVYLQQVQALLTKKGVKIDLLKELAK